MPTNFIYFDLGNVVLDFDHQLANRNVAPLCGATEEAVQDAMFGSGLEDQFERGELTPDQFAEQFFEAVGGRCDTQELMDRMSDIFTLNIHVDALIRRLHRQGCRLGILSNTCHAHWDWALRNYSVLADCFDIRVLSFEVQSMKPEPTIYEAAIASANLPAEEIFFMDDKEENVAGARKAGLDAIQFLNVEQLSDELTQRGVID